MDPGKTRVMEPVLATELENQGNHIYQVKWDGVRMLTFVTGGNVVLQNRNLRVKTSSFPELDCLANSPLQPLILDGEVISIRDGKPDFGMILRRNFAQSPGPGAPPISYVVFDVLLFQGEDLRNSPLSRRMEILAELKFPPPVTAIDNFTDGENLFTITAQRQWEGIVAKDLASPYIAGKSPYWKKFKHQQLGVFPIIGYIERQGLLASILVANDFGSGLEFAGAVGSGLSNAGRKFLKETLDKLIIPSPMVPMKQSLGNCKWVHPLLMAEVSFMEWTSDLTLRAPVLKKLALEGRKFDLP